MLLKALPSRSTVGKARGRLPPALLRTEGRERSSVAPHPGQPSQLPATSSGGFSPRKYVFRELRCLPSCPRVPGAGPTASARASVHTFFLPRGTGFLAV